jgi:predicted nucleotidyltransferase
VAAVPEIPPLVQTRLPIDELVSFCRLNGVQELWAFGSVLNDEWRPDSDVDLLVRFLPCREPELEEMFTLQEELAKLVGREVDLVEAASVVNPFVRKHIREHRVQLYAA